MIFDPETLKNIESSIDKKKQSLANKAGQFPTTTGEYIGMPVDERLNIAMFLIQKYARYDHQPLQPSVSDFEATYLPAKVSINPENSNTLLIGASVRYVHRAFSHDSHGLRVSAKGIDKESELETDYYGLGELVQMEKGGWQAIVTPFDSRRGGELVGPLVDLSHPEASNMVSVVDAVSTDLIERIVIPHSQLLGQQAVRLSR